jgi:hypothetical protein
MTLGRGRMFLSVVCCPLSPVTYPLFLGSHLMVGPAILRRVDAVLLAVACLLAVGLNWHWFVHEPLAMDEHVSFWISAGSGPGTLITRSVHYSATPPLFFVLQRCSMKAFGEREWATRLPAAASLIAAFVAAWWVGRCWLPAMSGGTAAVLLAMHPGIMPFAVAGRPYTLGILLSIVALHVTGRLCEAPKTRTAAALALVNLALIQTHYLFAAVWVGEFVWLLRARFRGQIAWRLFHLWLAGTALCVLTAAPGILHVWEYRSYLNWTTRRPQLTDLVTIVSPVQLAPWRPTLAWLVALAPLGWQIATRGFRPAEWFDAERWSKSSSYLLWCLVWLALPAAGLWLAGRYWLASVAADRYLIVFAPIATLLTAGLFNVWRGVVAPLLCLAACLHLSGTADRLYHATLGPVGLATAPLGEVNRTSSELWKAAAQQIGQQDPDCQLILVGSGLAEMSMVPLQLHDPVFHDYVSCRLGRMYLKEPIRRIGLPMFWPAGMQRDLVEFYRSEIARACGSGSAGERASDDAAEGKPRTFWLVTATDTDLLIASAGHARAIVESLGAVPLWSATFEGLELRQYGCPVSSRGAAKVGSQGRKPLDSEPEGESRAP